MRIYQTIPSSPRAGSYDPSKPPWLSPSGNCLYSDVTRQTVSLVINNWESLGIAGLYDEPRSGRPHILTLKMKPCKGLIEEEPASVKKIQAILEAERAKKVSEWTVKRILKRENSNGREFASPSNRNGMNRNFEKPTEIQVLEKRQLQGEIDLVYFDEAGFSLNPSSLMLAADRQNIEVPASQGARLNVLGL